MEKKKSYLVFGAAGFIGNKIAHKLLEDSCLVTISTKVMDASGRCFFELIDKGAGRIACDDVSDRERIKYMSDTIKIRFSDDLNGIIYSVGHCPPYGFHEAIKYPLSELPLNDYFNEIKMHQIGILNVFQIMLKNVKDNGCFVFLSSAITRLKGQFPPFLQAHYHASVISAEDWLIDGMRADPVVAKRNIKIHRIAPAAVDSPFHRTGPRPPKLIPVETVVSEIIDALNSDEHIDKIIL